MFRCMIIFTNLEKIKRSPETPPVPSRFVPQGDTDGAPLLPPTPVLGSPIIGIPPFPPLASHPKVGGSEVPSLSIVFDISRLG